MLRIIIALILFSPTLHASDTIQSIYQLLKSKSDPVELNVITQNYCVKQSLDIDKLACEILLTYKNYNRDKFENSFKALKESKKLLLGLAKKNIESHFASDAHTIDHGSPLDGTLTAESVAKQMKANIEGGWAYDASYIDNLLTRDQKRYVIYFDVYYYLQLAIFDFENTESALFNINKTLLTFSNHYNRMNGNNLIKYQNIQKELMIPSIVRRNALNLSSDTTSPIKLLNAIKPDNKKEIFLHDALYLLSQVDFNFDIEITEHLTNFQMKFKKNINVDNVQAEVLWFQAMKPSMQTPEASFDNNKSSKEKLVNMYSENQRLLAIKNLKNSISILSRNKNNNKKLIEMVSSSYAYFLVLFESNDADLSPYIQKKYNYFKEVFLFDKRKQKLELISHFETVMAYRPFFYLM
jgi:hypothetical protein